METPFEHTARRLLERFDISIGIEKYEWINKQIREGNAFLLGKKRGASHWLMELESKMVVFVYSRNSGTVKTALRPEWDSDGKPLYGVKKGRLYLINTNKRLTP
jgi:hypothetical protein